MLNDEAGKPALRWKFTNAWPKQYSAPSLSAPPRRSPSRNWYWWSRASRWILCDRCGADDSVAVE
ncbi:MULTISPECIES: hypothetical protein [unclassified Streptomyces]|uniref:hypothetical protein n=1 Tax=unclassified Streptomyces TaxID=2593676 RepID=UPI00338DE72D